jgi:tRNA pseudouridine55 synthase
MFGLLNLDKPAGKTSRDVVNRIQRLCRPLKVGHAGTLDPMATGVLVVALGAATRLVGYVQKMPKRYRATFLLGRSSDTEDVEGQVVEWESPPIPSRQGVEHVLRSFLGEVQQVPPAFSALKVQGRRAYALARQGKPVSLQPRPVRIDEIRVVAYTYPELVLDVQCGSGTYIRSLGRDIAARLRTAAVMSDLRRTAIGDFHASEAVSLDAVSAETLPDLLLSPRRAVSRLPDLRLDEQETRKLRNGGFLQNRWQVSAPELAGLDADGRLVAILAPIEGHRLKPVRNFPAEANVPPDAR